MQRLERMFGPSSNSTCAGAVNMAHLRSMRLSLSDLIYRIDVLPSHPGRDPVKYINIGAGTTGTTTLFQDVCWASNMTGSHWGRRCLDRGGNSVALYEWYVRMFNCTEGYHDSCNRIDAIRIYYENFRKSMSSGGTYWTDSPASEAFVDALRLNPEMSVIATYRNPDEWAYKRRGLHNRSLICSPSLWNRPGVLHPFDYIGCLRAATGSTVEGVIVQLADVTRDMLKHAYIKMSTVNAFHVALHDRPFLPICAFDRVGSSPVDAVLHEYPELDVTGKRAPPLKKPPIARKRVAQGR